MRVLLVHNRYRSAQPSGENMVVDTEAELLAEAGCVVERLETSSDEIASWGVAQRALLPGRVVWSRETYRLAAATIQRFGPDVVHVHNTFPLLSPAVLWAARHSGVGVVQTLHNFRPLCVAGSFFRDGRVCESCAGGSQLHALAHGCYRGSRAATAPLVLHNRVHRTLGTWLRCVDVFVAPSEFARRTYVDAGWPAGRIAVKPNTVRADGAAGTWHGAFAYVGRFGQEKGTDLLLAAWSQASLDGGAKLRMIGADGVAQAGVECFGRVEHGRTLELLAGSRALVVPSRVYEVFPRVIVEAYALGVPVIASRVGPLPELVEHGRTGLLFASGSADELALELRDLACSDERARALGRQARLAYEAHYSPVRTTEQLLGIYETALERRRD